MNYKIEGDNSPVLTVFLNKNELLSVKVGSDGWFSQNICEISSADNIIDALKNGLSEDRLFSRKYTSCADNAEITLIPDVSPCTIPLRFRKISLSCSLQMRFLRLMAAQN